MSCILTCALVDALSSSQRSREFALFGVSPLLCSRGTTGKLRTTGDTLPPATVGDTICSCRSWAQTHDQRTTSEKSYGLLATVVANGMLLEGRYGTVEARGSYCYHLVWLWSSLDGTYCRVSTAAIKVFLEASFCLLLIHAMRVHNTGNILYIVRCTNIGVPQFENCLWKRACDAWALNMGRCLFFFSFKRKVLCLSTPLLFTAHSRLAK